MKIKIRDIVSVCIFLILLFVSAALIRPAYTRLFARIETFAREGKAYLEDVTSLKISYKSLSPSVLSSVYLKGVELQTADGENVASIDKLRLSYSLFKIIRGDFNEGLNLLSAEGIYVDASSVIDLIPKVENPEGITVESDNPKSFVFDFSSFKADLPVDVVLKDVKLFYKNDVLTATSFSRKISATSSSRLNQVHVDMDAQLKMEHAENEYSAGLQISSNLYDAFENSSANIALSNLTDGNLNLNKLNFLLSYRNKVFSASTIKNTFPLVINAEYDLEKQTANALVKADELTLAKIFQVSRQNNLLKKAGGVRLSSETSVFYNLKEKILEYDSDSLVFVPSDFIPGGANVTLSVNGNDRKADIRKISLKNKDYDVSGDLEVVFKDLSVSGMLDVPKVVLPNGCELSTEIYFDPQKKGFMAFAPQLFVNEDALTALIFTLTPSDDSFDFSFEASDYSHTDADSPGIIELEGSYMTSSNYLQSSVGVNSIYVDSVMKLASNFMDETVKEQISGAVSMASDFMFSGDAYFSTDLKSVSFNVPYILLANTKKENQALMLSFDGNEQSVNLSQGDLILGSQALHASASLDTLPGTNDLFFVSEFIFNSIPYRYSGTFTNNTFNISGDYNTELKLNLNNLPAIDGSLAFDYFPIPVLDTSFIFSLNTGFSYSMEDGFELAVNRFETEEAGNVLAFKPRLSAKGNINRYGGTLNTINYSDIYSNMDGSADFILNMMDGIFNSASFSLFVKNPVQDENVTVNLNVSNPDMLPLDIQAFKENFYIDASVLVNRFNMNRFAKTSSDNNTLSASLYMTGTAEHPYVTAGLEKLNLVVSGNTMTASGSIMMEDKDISINELKVNAEGLEVNNVSGSFSLESFSGEAQANIDAYLNQDTVHVPLVLSVGEAYRASGRLFPESFTANLRSDGIYGSLLKKDLDFSLSLMYTPEIVSLVSSENMGLFAYYKKDGEIFANLNSPDIASLVVNGTVTGSDNKLKASVRNVNIDVNKIFSYLNFDQYVNIYSGILEGSMNIGGKLDNPDFMGSMRLNDFKMNLPSVIPDPMYTDSMVLILDHNEIHIPEKKLNIKKNSYVYATGTMFMDKWRMDHIEADFHTDKNKFVPVNLTTPQKMFYVTGDTGMDMKLVFTGKDMEISGNVNVEKAEVYLSIAKMVQEMSKTITPAVYVNTALDISMGTHVRLIVDPLLRSIFVPNGKLKMAYDQHTQEMVMDGTLLLKTGDVSYLNRNFYIKEGSIKFTPKDEGFNPLITVRAETREKDEDGDSVTIVLSAINQYLNDFTPKFSSIPAKSEQEIQSLLGQIVMADSENVENFLFAAGDYAIQTLVGRKIENKLRDLFNFDIFSLRTNIIQNTLNYSISDMRKNSTGTMRAGNFLDNSTVYIGKYLGSALYVDAMVNLQYDDRRVNDITTAGGLLFQPEFGMELESPWGNIRWNVAPDIDALLHKQYVPSSSLTLSWKFSL